jgi:adenylosuccinate lyase
LEKCYNHLTFFHTLLKALSPLDGRYATKLDTLRPFLSEYALMKYRCQVEIEWLLFLAARKDIPLRQLTAEEESLLQNIITNFDDVAAERIKEIEKTTNHDVKAIEYYLKEQISESSLAAVSEWIHFALTSEDVNNLSYALMLKHAVEQGTLPLLEQVTETLRKFSVTHKNLPMLSRTHGQPASPTTLGKEFLIFFTRVQRQIQQLQKQEYLGKIAGASGNFNAHAIAIPTADWFAISQQFVESLGLTWNPVVPQIEPHDFIAEVSHNLTRINTILIDLSRDIWGYISLGYFKQKVIAGEVGSSAMPHKVNPIDFENAEGNFGVSTALLSHFAEKLPISRWQRDLTDSTVVRNLGVGLGHHVLALQSLQKGLGKLEVNADAISKDLANTPEILAEAVQTVMRAHDLPNPYEQLKALSRGQKITLQDIHQFVAQLDIPTDVKQDLLELTPERYIGLAAEIVERFGK